MANIFIELGTELLTVRTALFFNYYNIINNKKYLPVVLKDFQSVG